MLQSDRRRLLKRLGVGWLCLVCLLAITAAVQRQRELTGVERTLIESRYRHFGEIGRHAREEWPTYRHSYALYLIENGRRKPELLRLMLISEACVVKHDSYMNRYSMNLDLRRMLMREVLPANRDDALVHWAAGVCLMNASQFGEAADELKRSLELGLDLDRFGIEKRDILLRIMLAAAMDGDPAETMQWVRETQLGEDHALNMIYADLLCRLYLYGDCIDFLADAADPADLSWVINDPLAPQPAGTAIARQARGGRIYLRALWYDGHYGEFGEFMEQFGSALQSGNPMVELITQSSPGWFGGVYEDGAAFMPTIRASLLDGSPPGSVDQLFSETNEISIRHRLMGLAEGYALLGRIDCHDRLADLLASGKQRLADGAYGMPNELDWSERNQLQQLTGRAYGQLLRAEVLRHDWTAVQQLMDDNEDLYFWPTPLAISSAGFLLGIVNGAEVAELASTLDGCIEAAPFLLHSPEYLAACAEGGQDPDELRRALVKELSRPNDPDDGWYGGNAAYWDSANGELDWGSV